MTTFGQVSAHTSGRLVGSVVSTQWQYYPDTKLMPLRYGVENISFGTPPGIVGTSIRRENVPSKLNPRSEYSE